MDACVCKIGKQSKAKGKGRREEGEGKGKGRDGSRRCKKEGMTNQSKYQFMNLLVVFVGFADLVTYILPPFTPFLTYPLHHLVHMPPAPSSSSQQYLFFSQRYFTQVSTRTSIYTFYAQIHTGK